MLESTLIPHPTFRPSWLSEWPSQEALDATFPPQVRINATHLANTATRLDIDWKDNVINAHIDSHLCTWRKNFNGWIRTCSCPTCKAVPKLCPHAYVVCLMLQKIFRDEGWLEDKTTLPPQASQPQTPLQQVPSYSAQPVTRQSPASEKTVLAKSAVSGPHIKTPPSVKQPAPSSGKSQYANFFVNEYAPVNQNTIPNHLLVEVDFQYHDYDVTIRFYNEQDGQKSLVTLAFIYNQAANLKLMSVPKWSAADADFLAWVLPLLRGIPPLMRAKNVLFITHKAFKEWQERWQAIPTRFIDKLSHKYLQPSVLAIPASLSVELVEFRGNIRFDAQFHLTNGKDIPVHEFFKTLAEAPDKALLEHEIKTFKSPIAWDVLYEHYSQYPPQMKRSHVPAHLSALVSGRLDILTGPLVTFKQDSKTNLQIVAGVMGNDFYLEGRLNGNTINLVLPVTQAKTTIIDTGKVFVIVKPNTDLIHEIRTYLTTLPFRTTIEPLRVRFQQSPENASMLKLFWASVPESYNKYATTELQELLYPNTRPVSPLQMQLTVDHGNDDNAIVSQLDFNWLINNDVLSTRTLKDIASGNSTSGFMKSNSGRWFEISPETAANALTKLEGLEFNAVLTRQLPSVITQLQDTTEVVIEENSRNFVDAIRKNPPAELPEIPAAKDAVLREYQQTGVQFLMDRAACGVGAILADDMGLGKTLQVLTVLDAFKNKALSEQKPFTALIICPASVMSVWQQQAQQFFPDLSTEILRGSPERRKSRIQSSQCHLLITHYALARADQQALRSRDYDFLILDEAQAIKNPEAKVTHAVSSFSAQHAIALTGTPLENSMLDLWSIMNCINPGFLCRRDNFTDSYMNRLDGITRLRNRIKPLILRRTKDMVAKELPPRTEQVIPLEMPQEQRDIYEYALARAQQDQRERGPAAVLSWLTRLREICCHPALVSSDNASCHSIKLERLTEQLTTLLGSGHSTLVFSQFTSMLQIIAQRLTEEDLPFLTITGETSLTQRQQLVEQFQNSDRPMVFLLSLKAAGTGLTLTRADYVFLFDPWWNPASEQQAIDRTHRIGQTNHVVAYRFITVNTVEEKVLKLIESKKALFNNILSGDGDMAISKRLTLTELQELLN